MLCKLWKWFAFISLLIAPFYLPAQDFKLQDSHLLWNEAPYNSFGDLIRFRGQWFCSMREAQRHMPGKGQTDNGKIRVIVSTDGISWTPAALIEEPGIDLRDPHLSVAADGRLMLVMGGSKYESGVFRSRRSRVAFSRDGRQWTAPRPVLEDGQWLWRVTWHKGKAYGVAYGRAANENASDHASRQALVASPDGVRWSVIAELAIPGGGETTLRFLADGRMAALMRRDRPGSTDIRAMIGVSAPPYKTWQWKTTDDFIGGPNFIVLPDGRMIAGGRYFADGDAKSPRTAVGFLTLDAWRPELILPSGGDSSYPGFVFRDGVLWAVYYSSPEPGRTAMYLARIAVSEKPKHSGK